MKRLRYTDRDEAASYATPLFAPRHAEAGETERAAAGRATRGGATLRARVLAWIVNSGPAGLTSKECRELFRAEEGRDDGYGCPPRFRELERLGLISRTGETRDGAAAWRAL